MINLPSWIWPLSWYRRILDLEATVADLKRENKALVNRLAAESISQASMTSCYLAAMDETMKHTSGLLLQIAAERDRNRELAELDAAYRTEVEKFAANITTRGSTDERT